MKHIFTTNRQELFVRNNSQKNNATYKVLTLIKTIGGFAVLFLKQLGLQVIGKSTTKANSEGIFTISPVVNTESLQEDPICESQIQDTNQLYHFQGKSESTIEHTTIKSKTTIKNYHIGGSFDGESKEWVPTFSDSSYTIKEAYKEDNTPPKLSLFRGSATTILLMLFSVIGVWAHSVASIDLALRGEIDNSTPMLNGTIKYKIWLKNQGATVANAILVKDNFPIGGATLTSHNGGANFSYTAGTGTGLWTVASLAAGDSVSLEMIAKVIDRGVFFNTAEIMSNAVGDTDSDSTPNNNNLAEDDIATNCFSVPLYWYAGDQYTVLIPTPYKYGTTIKWFRNGIEITANTAEAVINADTSLTIKSVGSYTFTTTIGACGAQGCCAIQVMQGPYGSIGDYVWKDKNDDGIQDANETGVKGIILELYTVDNSGIISVAPIKKDTTDDNGKYLFPNLVSGDYLVKISPNSLSDTSKISLKKDIGTDDTKDSDFSSASGYSFKVNIHVDSTGNKKDNLTVDAALYKPNLLLGSIGNYFWLDKDNDGVQDIDELGVQGIVLKLFAANDAGLPTGNVIQTMTTDNDGFYLFSNLIKGEYVVIVDTNSLPSGYKLSTMIDKGGNDNTDSDFTSTTGYSPKVSIDPAIAGKRNILSIDGAVHSTIVCPQLTVSTIDGDICVGDTTYLKGITSNSAKIKWYLSSVGGIAITTANSGDSYMIYPTTTTTYYAEVEGLDAGCPSTRQPVVIVVNARPSLPTCAGAVEECIGKTINLNDYVINGATTPGGTFEWHTTASEHSPLVTTPSAVGTGTYYLFEKSGAGCYSPPRLLKVTLKDCNKLIDLSLVKTVDNSAPTVGSTITYTIKVKNEGPDEATNVEITDELPVGLDFVSSSFFKNNNRLLTATITNIAAGQTITLNYTIKVITTGEKINFAQVSKADQKDVDSTPGNGSTTPEDDDDQVIVTPTYPQQEVLADLSLDKTVSKSAVKTGDQITYFIEVTNHGTSIATNVEVIDMVPAGLEVVTASGGDALNIAGNTILAKFNQINVGHTATFQIVAKVTATQGTIKNWAQITKSDQKDSDSTPNNGTDKNEDDDDDADINITPSVCNPVTPLIASSTPYICSGESVSIDAIGCNGTVVWSTGQTGNSISVIPTQTTIYTAKCKINDNCISSDSNPITITINVIAPPTITSSSTNNTICGGASITLTATSCSGIVIWSTDQTATSIAVSPTTTTQYWAICKTNTCISTKSNIITVTVGTSGTPPTIIASKNVICKDQPVTITASGCNGIVVWSNGMSGTAITFTPAQTGSYSAKCKVGECETQPSASVTIEVISSVAAPVISANKENICVGETVILSTTGCSGTLVWSNGGSGTSISVTPGTTTTYEVSCSIAPCSAKASKVITVTPKPAPPIIVVSKEVICSSEAITFTAHNCDGTVVWSTGATTATMTASPTATTTYTATCSVNGCISDSSLPKTITVSNQTPAISASKETICSGSSTTLTASSCSGTLLWNTGASTSSITVTPTVTGTYSVKCIAGTCESSASKTIIVNTETITPPTITSSATALCESGNVTLTATGCTGIVIWSNLQTGTSITVNVTGSVVFAAACQVGECESGKSNSISLTVGQLQKPTLTSNKTTICTGDAVILTATNCSGNIIWSNGLTGGSVTVHPINTTEYTAVCKSLQGTCISDMSAKLVITVTSKPDAPIIACTCARPRICKGDTLTLKAMGCNGTFLWSTGETTTSIVVSPVETHSYTVICKLGSCESAPSAAATVNVGSPSPPLISCKKPQICGGTSTQLEGAGCVGTVKWSDGQIGAIITVSPTTMTSYSAICDAGNCQSEKSNTITVQVTGAGLKKPTTKDLVNICPYTTVDLTTGITSQIASQGGVFVFRTGTTPGSPAIENPSAMGTGSYYAFEKAGNGCFSDASKINVQIITCGNPIACGSNPATVTAGKDTTICLKDNFLTLNGKIGGAAQSAKWTTDGKGTFDNSLALTTKYHYSNEDVTKGLINFTLTTNDPDDNGPCQATTSTFKVTLNGVKTPPTIQENKSPNICFGDSVTLSASQTGTYQWSNGATTKDITVKTPGVFSVKLLNEQGCSSLNSNEIIVTLSTPITAPTVVAVAKNNCPSTTVNLTNAVSSSPKTQGGVFEFHTGAGKDSPIIANATSVSAGVYYVLEKSPLGCYSSTSSITAMIDQCNANPVDTANVELGIVIIGSRVELKIGDPITYTITVKNNTTHTATNVHIVNVLPKGLEITSTTPGLTAFGHDSLIGLIGSFPGGAIKTYTYTAKTIKAGKIINIAKITKLDQIDPITSNNISKWEVECKTCQETCVGMSLAADTTRQSNGSYNITFRAFIESCGNVKLEGVKITENLLAMFTTPVTYTIIQKPTAGTGSKLKMNDSFNGSTDLNLTIPEGSELEAGLIDTVKFVVNIVPNGSEGPFTTNAIVEAIGNTIFGVPQDVSDVSNNGKYIDKPSAEPTVVRLFKTPSIGLTKIVLDTTKKVNGSYDVTYLMLVKNNGALLLNDVVVTDTLSKVFYLPSTFTVPAAPVKNTNSTLTINTAFNGTTDTRLTLPGSTLTVGKTDTLKFTVNIQPDTLKTFANTAIVNANGTLASGTKQTVTDVSNAGMNPDVPGSNPTILNLESEGGSSIEVPCIGLALYVKDTLKLIDGSYNVTFHAIIKNCGNLSLSTVQLCDTLSNTFPAGVTTTIAQPPIISNGSSLKANIDYNGVSNTCLLLSGSEIAPNKIDTVKWVVNVKLNGNKGPFKNTIVVTAKTPSGLTISDVSNDGINPNQEGSTPTVINFNSLPEALIGISKEASEPVKISGSTYEVTFKFKVKNYGKTDFAGIQVQDNLAVTFGDSVKIDSVHVTADAGFAVNPNFTGRGSLINLLVDSLSTLPKNTTRNITLFTRVTLAANKNTFENQALAIGKYPANKSVDDLSTNGTDPDPDANGTPKDNSIPTPVNIQGFVINPPNVTTLGIAKSAELDSIPNADDTYNLMYRVIVTNYGTQKLTHIQLSDSLENVFADSSEFIIAQAPVLNSTSKLKVNNGFNGRNISTMLIADSSSLAAGVSDTLIFKLRVLTTKIETAFFSNSIYGSAKDSTKTITDISQAGVNADPDNDSNPGNNNEPTIVAIIGKTPVSDSLVVIPEGFSPNGDGIGDKFSIKGINKTSRMAKIYIYNRWGELVYRSDDFGKEEGWDGMSNEGIILLSKGKGVPDGTYYYSVQADGLWEGKHKIGFITVVR